MNNSRNKLTLAVIFILFILFFIKDSYDDLRINISYQPTHCMIINTQMPIVAHGKYMPLVGVSYQVNGTTYSAWAPARHAYPKINNLLIANHLLSNYTVNSMIPCWYDPLQPGRIILEHGYHYIEIAFVIIMLIFAFFLWLITRLNRNYTPSGSIKSTTHLGHFQVITRKWTIEYIYQSKTPITEELLPAEYKNRSPAERAYCVKTINQNGKFIKLNPILTKLITLFFAIIFVAEMTTIALLFLIS